MPESLDLSIVIPLLNEEESLRPLFQKIENAVGILGLSFEVIFIDDGSTDGSVDVLKELRGRNNSVKIIRFRRNFGKSAAYSAAFSRVLGKYVITMDAERRIFSDGAVAVAGGRITAVGQREEVTPTIQAARRIPGQGKVVIPGLINAHS